MPPELETMDQTTTHSEPEIAINKGDVIPFSAPRLPYHEIVQERFNVDRAGWKTLCDAIFPNAKSGDAIALALSYCKARNLDVFKRPIHIVPMWSTALGRMVETIWPSIAELRTTAFRTKQDCGLDCIEWGPMIEKEFSGKPTRGANKGHERTITVKFPEWCRITVLRAQASLVGKFIGPKVVWLESYATWADTDVPNEMWTDRAEGQLEKCAEAAALRRAFPEELGNQYAAEEMEGRRIFEEPAAAIIPVETPPDPPGQKSDAPAAESAPPAPGPKAVETPPTPPTPPAAPSPNAAPAGVGAAQAAAPPARARRKNKPRESDTKVADTMVLDEAQWLKDFDGALGSCTDPMSLFACQQTHMQPMRPKVSVESWKAAETKMREHIQRIQDETLKA